MTDYRNFRVRLENQGLDLVHSPDAVEAGKFTRLKNIFAQRDGEMSSRGGTDQFLSGTTSIAIHSMRRLDENTLLIGSGTNLYRSDSLGGINLISGGWSGNPLSFVRFRPANSSDQWIYIGDSLKAKKIRATGGEVNWGITRLASAPVALVNGAGNLDSTIPGAIPYTYVQTFFAESTTAESNPSDPSAEVSGANFGVDVTVIGSPDPQVSHVKIYRKGGTDVSDFIFIAQIPNPPLATIYHDTASDLTISQNDIVDEDNDVPFTTVDTSGTTLFGTPLPYIFGPFIGRYILATGDPNRPGYVYWTNSERPDSASSTNNVQVTNPSEPLVGGFIYASNAYVWSRDNLYTLDFGGPLATPTFTPRLVPIGIGVSGPNAFTANGPGFVFFLSKDGIYVTDCQNTLESLTDDTLRPIFRGTAVSGFQPVNREQPARLRLEVNQQELHFWYLDTNNAPQHIFYDLLRKRWQQYEMGTSTRFIFGYSDENRGNPRLLLGGDNGRAYQANVTTPASISDDGVAIPVNIRTGSSDMEVPQTLKEFGNVIIDLDPGGLNNSITVTPYLNAELSSLTPTVISGGGGRQKIPINLGDNYAYNIALDFSWNYQSAHPSDLPVILYQLEYLFRVDEEVLKHWEMPETSHGIAGWMHVRDAYFCLRSLADVTFTHTIDGVTHTYILPSTVGERRRVYIRLAPIRGKVFRYSLDSTTGFRLYGEDSQLNIKGWNDTGYKPVYPFTAPGYAPFLRKEAGT